MNTFQLSCFLAVAETLNFARAAEHLHVTQPAVTQQIHSLEKELNVRLFRRTTRIVKLTEEGLVFLHDAQHIMALTQRAVKRFENPHDSWKIQTLSLGCYSYTLLFLLPPALEKLAALHPAVHPRLHVVPFQHLYRQLEEDDVDAVIGFREPASKKISAVYKEIRKVPVVCVCSPSNPLCQRQSVALEDLEHEKLVLLDPVKTQSDAAQLQGRLVGSHSPSELYFCESAEAAVILAQAGLGISILPELFIPPDSTLSCIPIRSVDPVSFGLYYKSTQGKAVLRDLLGILKSTL